MITYTDAGGPYEERQQHEAYIKELERKLAQAVELLEKEYQARNNREAQAVEYERTKRYASRLVDSEEVSGTTSEPEVLTFRSMMDEPVDDEQWRIEGLMHQGSRILFAAHRKSGKTVTVLNLCKALACGTPFLGAFNTAAVSEGRTVLWLNNELTKAQAKRWVHRLFKAVFTVVDGHWVATAENLNESSRLVAASMRGSMGRISLVTPAGVAELTQIIRDSAVEVLVVDPVAPLMAVSGLDPYSSNDIAMFMTILDSIAAQCGVSEIVYVSHVSHSGSQDQDHERAKGDSRWEDAVDAMWYLTKDRNMEGRSFRAEGRDVDQPSLSLNYDPSTIAVTADEGGRTRTDKALDVLIWHIIQMCEANPGILKTPLRDSFKGRHDRVETAITQAYTKGLVSWAPQGGGKAHFATPEGLMWAAENVPATEGQTAGQTGANGANHV